MRKKLFVLLVLLALSTSAFADGVIGSGTRSEPPADNPQIGSGADAGSTDGRGIMGSGGLQRRIVFALLSAFRLDAVRGR